MADWVLAEKQSKNPEIPRFVPDHIKTKMICRNAIQKILFVTKYVLDWCKNQEMCYKIILGNSEC